MPTIDVYPDVPRAYNRVEVNWADNPSVTHARVLRVDVESGTCTPLRPYICFNGDYLLLSCGHGIFWDTEVPLDRSVYYITEGLDAPCIPQGSVLLDNFNRNNATDWGDADVGGTWQYISTAAGQATVTVAGGGRGRMEFDVAGDITGTFAGPILGRPNVVGHMLPNELITGAGSADIGLATNVLEPTSNRYEFLLRFFNTGLIDLRINRSLNNVVTVLTTISTPITYVAGSTVGIRAEVDGSTLRMKAWNLAFSSEPTAWNIEFNDTVTLPPGHAGTFWRVQAGNTNVPDYFPAIGYIEAVDSCLPCTPVTVTSEPSMMPSNGAFRIKDPVRPCNDIYMPLCFDQSTLASHTQTGQYCAPGTGVFFASMETESYDANSFTVNPTNARRPIAITRQRRDVSSNLTVVSRTFNDRDALLRLAAPGSPILLQGPPQYGIPDRYMSVGTVAVDRGLTDHKFQVRIVQMPHVAVDRPAGPQNGVCGSRVTDLCDFTFNELAAEGNTWEDLVRGRPTGGVAGYRTWDDVLAEFTDWDDVNNGVRDWHDLEVGD